MSIYVIGDLHLSFSCDKPMDIYGGQWVNHTEKVKEHWQREIKEEDTVIIAGDISWGLKLEEAMADLKWISELPGHKVLFKGNHDLWWNGIGKLNKLFSSITFMQNTCFETEDYIICGTRGWICPGDTGFADSDRKIYLREQGRLRMSLEAGVQLNRKNETQKELIGVIHYPPMNEKMEESGFSQLFEEYKVSTVVYGHLHGKDAYGKGFAGIKNGVEYILVSCDKLECKPLKIR